MIVTLPWKPGPASPTGPIVLSATRSTVHRWRDLPSVVVRGTGVRGRWASVPGAVGLASGVDPLRRETWTTSAWRSEDDLRTFLRTAEHRKLMRDYGRRLHVDAVTWTTDRLDVVDAVNQARRRLLPTGDDAAARTLEGRTVVFALAKIAFGLGLFTSPGRVSNALFGRRDLSLAAGAFGRGMGARDIAVGLGILAASTADERARWVAVGAASDAADAMSAMLDVAQPTPARWATGFASAAMMAMSGAWLHRRLRQATVASVSVASPSRDAE